MDISLLGAGAKQVLASSDDTLATSDDAPMQASAALSTTLAGDAGTKTRARAGSHARDSLGGQRLAGHLTRLRAGGGASAEGGQSSGARVVALLRQADALIGDQALHPVAPQDQRAVLDVYHQALRAAPHGELKAQVLIRLACAGGKDAVSHAYNALQHAKHPDTIARARLYLAKLEPDKLMEHCRAVLAADPDDEYRALAHMGLSQTEDGDRAQHIRTAMQLGQACNIQAWARLSLAQDGQGNSAELFHQVLEMADGPNLQAHAHLGLARLPPAQGKTKAEWDKERFGHYTQALRLKPSADVQVQALLDMGQIHLARRAEYCRQALNLARTESQKAEVLVHLADIPGEDALAHGHAALRLAPDDRVIEARAHLVLGEAGDADVVGHFQKVIARVDDPDLRARAFLGLAREQHDHARAHYQAVLALPCAPVLQARAWLGVAEDALDTGAGDTVQALSKVMTLAESPALKARAAIGIFEAEGGLKTDEDVRFCRVIQKESQDPDVLARVLLLLGERHDELPLLSYRKALELAHAPAVRARVHLALARTHGRGPQMREHAQAALALARAPQMRAQAHLLMAESGGDQAVDHARAVLKIAGVSEHAVRACLVLAHSEPHAVSQHVRKALELTTDTAMKMRLYLVLAQHDETPGKAEALQCYQHVLEQTSNRVYLARAHLGLAQNMADDKDYEINLHLQKAMHFSSDSVNCSDVFSAACLAMAQREPRESDGAFSAQARNLYDKALARAQDSNLIARIHMDIGLSKGPDGFENFHKVVYHGKDFNLVAQAHLKLAQLELVRCNPQAAQRHYRAVIDGLLVGDACDRARQGMEQIERNPVVARCLAGLECLRDPEQRALLHMEMVDLNEGDRLTHYRAVLELVPQHELAQYAHYHLAVSGTGNVAAHYRAVTISLLPDSYLVDAHLWLGDARDGAAEGHYRTALMLGAHGEEKARALVGLGELAMDATPLLAARTPEGDDRASLFSQALEITQNPDVRARALIGQGDSHGEGMHGQRVALYQQALELAQSPAIKQRAHGRLALYVPGQTYAHFQQVLHLAFHASSSAPSVTPDAL